jgi:hypothetical protein
VKSFRLLIEHQCPQCGAPATLEETDHLFTCEFCRVKSYLLSRVFHYVLPHAAEKDKDLIFFPYWRFKGMLFSCISNDIKHRIVDVSYQAVRSPLFPVSVGLRSQTLKLRFVSPETEGYFLKPSLASTDITAIIEERYSVSLPKPLFHQCFIGDTLGQIYSPFYVDGRLYDAVLNRPVPAKLPGDFDISAFPGGRSEWQIRFIPTLCPNCGWDLEGERDSLVLNCRNCSSAWYPAKDRLTRLKFSHIPSEKGGKVTYLPFYRIKAEVSGIGLDSYADLAKVANLPKVAQGHWKDVPFHFWSLAFKVRPKEFLGFSRNVTLVQPHGKWVPELPDAPFHPVTLPVTEATEGLKITLASFMKPRRTLFPKIQEINIKPLSFMLVLVPFEEKTHEFIHQAFGLRISKNLLGFARHL